MNSPLVELTVLIEYLEYTINLDVTKNEVKFWKMMGRYLAAV